MLFPSLILMAAAAIGARGASVAPQSYPYCRSDINTPEYHRHIATNYLDLWAGHYNLLDQTISPVMTFQSDSFPLSTNCSSGAGARQGNIHSATDFVSLVAATRSGFSKYAFTSDLMFGQDNNVVIRWALQGVIGAHFTVLPTTLKPGDPVTYNGTEILVLNKCTGLADKVISAQDLITFFGNLGLKAVTV